MERDLNIDEKQIRNSVNTLKKLGLVEVIEQGGTVLQPDGSYKWLANVYRVNFIDIEEEQGDNEN